MKLVTTALDSILTGKKTIELRLYDEKRRKLSIGDLITFQDLKLDRKLIVEVVNLHIFSDFHELYKFFPKTSLGYLEEEVALPEDMQIYYSLEDIKKYGVVGIEVKVLKKNI
ncbi:MAG: RNA-binding protein [Bacilli bacterium]|nr:RNA-binding protein [Bacilli bacterium]